jgi:hypothetical protein
MADGPRRVRPEIAARTITTNSSAYLQATPKQSSDGGSAAQHCLLASGLAARPFPEVVVVDQPDDHRRGGQNFVVGPKRSPSRQKNAFAC